MTHAAAGSTAEARKSEHSRRPAPNTRQDELQHTNSYYRGRIKINSMLPHSGSGIPQLILTTILAHVGVSKNQGPLKWTSNNKASDFKDTTDVDPQFMEIATKFSEGSAINLP